MAYFSADKTHLMPLLEFLRFVSARGGGKKNRFPKKINGVMDRELDLPDPESDQDSSSASPTNMIEITNGGECDYSSFIERDGPTTFATLSDRRKRLRSPESGSDVLIETTSVPIECEVVEKTPGKGCFTSKYFDFSLSDLGLTTLLDLRRQALTKEVAKQIQGVRCCYLLLGTSMIVTGDIIDASLTGDSVLVSPDRGLRVDIEWVSLKRVFLVPENIGAVREEAAQRIERIMEAERQGEDTPRISPVLLAKTPTAALFPPSPVKGEQ